MSHVLSLYRLQTIDTQRDQILDRLRKIEAILKDDEKIRLAKATQDQAASALKSAQTSLKDIESSVKNQAIKIELDERALYGGKVRSPKELQDLQSEVESLKRYLVTLEERQLEAMIFSEDQENSYRSAASALQAVENQSAEEHHSLISESELLRRRLEHVDEERRVAAAQIPADLIPQYDRLRLQKRGIAVTKVEDCACTSCGAELTPAECQAAKSPNQVKNCPSCNRILYVG